MDVFAELEPINQCHPAPNEPIDLEDPGHWGDPEGTHSLGGVGMGFRRCSVVIFIRRPNSCQSGVERFSSAGESVGPTGCR
jgi:hypothetical protein